mmetsp:Transcript_8011/g.11979  ORF Transcript_8011/g.11979 Transcript_8011/m.11979 type:complete len:497 (-) Transcript_8011:852-2342(-)|eukprot:scaffold1803_cov150-Skeletonema_marinoi.AAC.5
MTTKLSAASLFISFSISGVSAGGGYCNWGPQGTASSSTCELKGDGSHVQGGTSCNQSQGNCQGCGGRWCTNDIGYCNWGPAGTAASSTCDGDVQGGDYCNVGPSNCQVGCGGNWCETWEDPSGPTPPPTPSPPSPTPPPPTPPTGGNTATTTRYWDCSGGSCGCSFIPTGLGTAEPVHCHSNAMFVAPSGNQFGAAYYGAAAISEALGGGNWMSSGCGKCWKVTGYSPITALSTTLVLKGTNFCPPVNAPCSNGKAHFDIAAPGFDVTEFSLSNTCSEREPEEATGFAACGGWMINSQNPNENCNCDAFTDPVLKAGCNNFYNLKWDNPQVEYEEVDCPNELAELHCDYPYATESNMPETCSNNLFTGTTSSATTTATTTTSTAQTTSSTSTTTTTTNTTPQTTTTTTSSTTTTTQPPNGSSCCSHDYSTCSSSDWCNASSDNCLDSCSGKAWIEPDSTCIPLYGECTQNRGGCCNPLGNVACKRQSNNYRQCLEK